MRNAIDEKIHFQYFSVSVARFDDLLQRLAPHMSRERTHSMPVNHAERLSVTLRFLASGSTQQSIAANYKTGISPVYGDVKEVIRI